MSFRPKKSPKGSGKLSKTAQEKKNKAKKQRQAAAKQLQDQTPQVSPVQISESTLSGVNRLGNQIFALSPFSQYFDDWLVNLRQVISDFETTINADELFHKERTQIFSDISAALAEKRLAESTLTEEAKALEENNHKIADADKEYAEKSREINNKRNAEIQKLANTIQQLEDDLAAQQQVKLGFFKFKEKKLAAERLDQTNKEFNAAKNELEVKIESFKVEQEKLHDYYEKRKQELNEVSDSLHKQLEKLETDTSAEVRQNACNALVQAINTQMQRIPAS